jgi:hypothetical protein
MSTTETAPAPAPVTVTIEGVRVHSEANTRGAWYGKYRRARGQKELVLAALARLDRAAFRACPGLRCTFTRVVGKRGRKFDDDNLVGAFKACRDAVAAAFAVDDGSDWWEWRYDREQPRGAEYGVRITFAPRPAGGAG